MSRRRSAAAIPGSARSARAMLDGERAEFRVWAPAGADDRAVRSRRPGVELRDAGYGVYEATSAPPRPATDYCVRGRRAASCPIRARAGSREGLRGPSRVLRAGPARRRGFAAARARASWSSTSCTSARSPPRARSTAAIAHLRELAELGVTAIELMPVAEFPGARGWGYDGVYISRRAVRLRRPGGPAAARRAPPTGRARGDPRRRLQPPRRLRRARRWRRSGPTSPTSTRRRGARRSTTTTPTATRSASGCCQSAEGWVRDFGIDGLRLDAIHAIFDSSAEHIVAAIARRVHAVDPRALRDRRVAGSTTRA